jgi:hypothetical protein
LMFDYFVNEKGEYSEAARILVGMRMESEPNSIYYKTPAEMCDGTSYFPRRANLLRHVASIASARLIALSASTLLLHDAIL